MARLAAALALTLALVTTAGPACAQSDATDDVVQDPVEVEDAPVWGVWDRLAECESRGNWAAATGNGFYGGTQTLLSTWRAYGGQEYASRPDYATRAQQIAVNERILAGQGWASWPTCSRMLGLR